ncbi:MAG: carbamoyltransferase HypF [Promethearchaeota archaeon]
MSGKTLEINITGIVQGVGFRPFLFYLATRLGLKGYILNRGNAGVRLMLQGKSENLEQFTKDLDSKKPDISFIESIEVNTILTNEKFHILEIRKSEEGRGIGLTLPPDISTCKDCINDMKNPNLEKYFQYPFVACAACGPRFTTVNQLPYDRERTTMVKFPLCEKGNPSCLQEYKNAQDRRFHAQTFACKNCGPRYKLYDTNRNKILTESLSDILDITAKRINAGEICAIKGIGGVHLACLASNDETIIKLRKAKGKRKNKPFAVMVPDLKLVENIVKITPAERSLLLSFRSPIVLLDLKDKEINSILSEYIAPGLNNIGIMLPYSGIHHLLFEFIGRKPLIYTSGNPSNIPMSVNNDEIFEQLKLLADFFLLHDRRIYQRADDSVARVHGSKTKLIRRSRGYVPEYIPLPFKVDLQGAIATGPELATTGAILRGNRIFPTQHIGNVTHLETHDFLKNAILHMKSLLQIEDSEIAFISCDAHPAFITTKFAKELSAHYNAPLYPVQHHYAHVLGLMAENNVLLEETIIGISTDGVGYGSDGNIWGGEVLKCSYENLERVGHLKYQPMIGGDRCTKYPARMAISILLGALDESNYEHLFTRLNVQKDLEYGDIELRNIISQYNVANGSFSNKGIPLTSSTGRVLDAISYLLGACNIKTYRGEPAMRLEGLASNGDPTKIQLKVKSYDYKGQRIIDTSTLILDIIRLIKQGKKKIDIAARAQIEIGKAFAGIAIDVAEKEDIQKIGLTGGVSYNQSFNLSIKKEIESVGLTFIEHEKIPPGDAGISSGQLIGGLFVHQNLN